MSERIRPPRKRHPRMGSFQEKQTAAQNASTFATAYTHREARNPEGGGLSYQVPSATLASVHNRARQPKARARKAASATTTPATNGRSPFSGTSNTKKAIR